MSEDRDAGSDVESHFARFLNIHNATIIDPVPSQGDAVYSVVTLSWACDLLCEVFLWSFLTALL